MTTRLVPLTDARGRVLVTGDELHEPNPGSIVLTSGQYGTAWQRHFTDGKWYAASSMSKGVPWREIIQRRNLVLVYDAPERGM